MLRRFSAVGLGVLLASLVLAVSGSGSATAPTPKLTLSIIGPAKVVPGTNIQYYLTLKNAGKTIFKQVRLTLIPLNVITRSSVPCKRSFRPIYKSMTANWVLKNFKAGTTYRVRLMLRFPVVKGVSSYGVLSEAHGTAPFALITKERDVFYRQPA